MMTEAKCKVVENRVYQAKGAYYYRDAPRQEGFDAVNLEFQRMFEADSITLVEQLAHDWLTQLHGPLTHFEIHSIGKAEDIITWD